MDAGTSTGTERPRSRTEPAWGCQTSPVLKTSGLLSDLQGFCRWPAGCAPARAPVRARTSSTSGSTFKDLAAPGRVWQAGKGESPPLGIGSAGAGQMS